MIANNTRKKAHWWRRLALLLFGSLFVLASLSTGCRRRARATPVSPTPTLPPPVATSVPPPQYPGGPGFGFATLNAVPEDRATARNIGQIRAEFARIKDLGIKIIVQGFAVDSTEADWRAYLDAAAQEGMKVIGWFRTAPPKWTGSQFDLGPNGRFLASMKDHPALYAFFLIDEPFHRKHGWDITAERLQMLYRQAKEIAPNVPIGVQFSREIQQAEEAKDPRFGFKSGMCDICVISALEFRNYGDGNRFYRDVLIANQHVSRAVIKREDPKAKIWTTVQVFGSATGGSSYYMPSPAELQEMVDLLLSPQLQVAGALDGMVWQQWTPFVGAGGAGQYNLSHPECEAHREIVRATAKRLGLISSP